MKSLGVVLIALISFIIVTAKKTEIFPDFVKILTSAPSGSVSETCAADIRAYGRGIMEEKIWALQMVDSITKFPDGVLMGHISIPGHFDECVNARNEKFSGKHCMTNLKVKGKRGDSQLPDFYYERDSDGLSFKYGICMPSTCNSTDIQNAIKDVTEQLKFFEVNVTENECSTKEFRPFRTEDWITVGVIIIISIVAFGCTAYDLTQRFVKKNEEPNKLWLSFSVYTNGKQLLGISQSSSQLKCLNGIRFLSMCWVILGHSYFSFVLGDAVNLAKIPEIMNDKSFIPISNAFVAVDSFFFLSGLLVCLVFFRDISKKKTFDVPVAFIHRYMRLTPPFALLTLVQATVISRIGNGPFWNVRADQVEVSCRDSWWTGLLYVQNYVKPSAMCLGQAWYLSADMQMYWVSPLILYPMLLFPSFAPFLILILVFAAACTNFAVAFVNNLQPNLFIELSWALMKQFELEYSPFHTRMAPWLVGLATGYVICGIQAKKIRLNMSKLWIVLGWIAALSLLGGSLFGIARFVGKEKTEYTAAESALYLALHRVGWALGMAWVVIACVGGYGGPVYDFLSLDFFQPLAKLSYCNFLIHMTLQNYRTNSSRINQYIGHFNMVYAYFGDLLISHLISIPVVLLFETPFTNIDRYFFQNLVIFPLPKPKKEDEKKNRRSLSKEVENVEEGKENPAFSES